MDFHVLSRKELQALCKKNLIPANMTNVAMANALAALDKVEGLDEFLNPPKSDPQHSPERTMQISTEPESSQPLTRTRRTTRKTVAEEAQTVVNKDGILPKTPAVPASRRRAIAGQEKSSLVQTPAMRASAQRKQEANSTRRSVRLMEKSMPELGLMDNGRVEAIKVDGFSKEFEDVYEKNHVSGAAMRPKDSSNAEDSCVNNNDMETEEPSMHDVLDTVKPSLGVLGEGSDSSQSLLEDFSNQNLEAKDEYNGFNAIQSVAAAAPCAALSPEIKKSLNTEDIETEQPSIVNVADSVILSNLALPEISSDEKSKATDQCKNHTEISEDSNAATNDQVVVSLDLQKDEGSDSHPTLAEALTDKDSETMYESEDTEFSDFSNATNNRVAAPPPLNCASTESKMDSCVGVNAIEYRELDKTPPRTSETEVDVKEMTVQDFSTAGRKTPTPLKQTSPCEVSSPIATNNHDVAADGNIEATLNSSSFEFQMERFASVDATEIKELNKLSWDSDRTYPRTYETFVDVKELPIEEFSSIERKTSAPVKQASPCQQPLAADGVSSSPFAEGTLEGQFPRPSQPMAKTTSAEKQTTILAGLNKENIEYGSREVEMRKCEADKKDMKQKPLYDDMSLRSLRKKLKELQLMNKSEKHAEENKEGKRRMASQMRAGNCMHAAEADPKEEMA